MRPASATRALLAALLLAAAARPAAARAASKADAFEGKIKPISGQLYQKAGRFELTPLAALSVDDAFFTKYFGGLKATWHFSESWSVSGAYAVGTSALTGSAVVCPVNQGCQAASAAEMYQVPGRLRSVAGLEVAWAPIYGKLNVLAERVAHFDLSLVLGADLVAHDRVLSADDAIRVGLRPSTVRTVGGHVGLGARLFLSEAVALRLEFRDLVYRVDVPNRAGSGLGAGDVQNQLLTEVGLSVFFPFTARAGRAP